MNILMKAMEIKNNKRAYLRYYEETYGLTLIKHQLEILESKDEIIETRLPRQYGGTTALLIKAIEYAINNQMSEVMLVYNSSVQIKCAFEMFKDYIERYPVSRHILKSTINPYVVDFINGSRISFVSSKIAENSRGKKVDCLIVDGKRYISNDMLNTAITCTCHNPNRQIILLD